MWLFVDGRMWVSVSRSGQRRWDEVDDGRAVRVAVVGGGRQAARGIDVVESWCVFTLAAAAWWCREQLEQLACGRVSSSAAAAARWCW
jgi:hypothetical protein